MLKKLSLLTAVAAGSLIAAKPLLAMEWTQVGSFDSEMKDPTKETFLTVTEYIPSGYFVEVFLTSNGDIIKNADDTMPFFRWDNSFGLTGLSKDLVIPFHIANGKEITDVHQVTNSIIDGVLAALAAAAFDSMSGSMFPLSDWLSDSGFVGNTILGVPDFFSPTQSDIFFAVDMQQWVTENFVMSTDSLGSEYSIVNGVAVSRISGNGPDASQLSSFLFANSSISADPAGFWTSSDLYTGNAEIFGWHEFGTVPVPFEFEATAGLALLGLYGAWEFNRRKRKAGKKLAAVVKG